MFKGRLKNEPIFLEEDNEPKIMKIFGFNAKKFT